MNCSSPVGFNVGPTQPPRVLALRVCWSAMRRSLHVHTTRFRLPRLRHGTGYRVRHECQGKAALRCPMAYRQVRLQPGPRGPVRHRRWSVSGEGGILNGRIPGTVTMIREGGGWLSSGVKPFPLLRERPFPESDERNIVVEQEAEGVHYERSYSDSSINEYTHIYTRTVSLYDTHRYISVTTNFTRSIATSFKVRSSGKIDPWYNH